MLKKIVSFITIYYGFICSNDFLYNFTFEKHDLINLVTKFDALSYYSNSEYNESFMVEKIGSFICTNIGKIEKEVCTISSYIHELSSKYEEDYILEKMLKDGVVDKYKYAIGIIEGTKIVLGKCIEFVEKIKDMYYKVYNLAEEGKYKIDTFIPQREDIKILSDIYETCLKIGGEKCVLNDLLNSTERIISGYSDYFRYGSGDFVESLQLGKKLYASMLNGVYLCYGEDDVAIMDKNFQTVKKLFYNINFADKLCDIYETIFYSVINEVTNYRNNKANNGMNNKVDLKSNPNKGAIKYMAKKHNKGKNKKNALTYNQKYNKHDVASEEYAKDISSEVVLVRKDKLPKKSIFDETYDPNDMFNKFEDIYFGFNQN